MVDFRSIIDKLQTVHFYDVVLPFLLVYVIVYAILEKSKIFKVSGEGANNKHLNTVHVVISLVFGLFTIVSIQTVMHIQYLIVNIVLFMIFILVLLILLAFMFGEDYMQLFFEKTDKGNKIKPWAAWVVGLSILLICVGVLLQVTGALEVIIDWFKSTDWSFISTLLAIAGIGLVIYMVSREGKSSSDSK